MQTDRLHLCILFVCVTLLFILIALWQMQKQPTGIYSAVNSIWDAMNSQANLAGQTTSADKLKNSVVTYDNIDPRVWERAAGTITTLNTDSQQTTSDSAPATTPVNLPDGLYVRTADHPVAGDIGGTFDSGLSIGSNAVALGSDTTGDYVASVTAGDGLESAGNGEGAALTLSIKAGDGIAVDGDGIGVALRQNGGLTMDSGELSLLTSCSDGQLLKWVAGSATWVCGSDNAGAGALTVREADGSPTVTPTALLEFGPASNSSDEFIITDQGGGTARVRTGTAVPLTNATQTISGVWTFSSQIAASGGLSCTDCIALGSETSGNYLAGLLAGNGVSVTGSGSEGASPTVSLDSSLAIFKTIDASLGTDPVADSLTDTLTLSSGNGVNVTGDGTADSVSFSLNLASGSGLAFSSGALTLQSCSDGQILKYASGAWACAADADTDTNTTYSAGSGLSLSSTTFSLNTANANTWSGLQTFSSGFALNGNTFTNLVGTGLNFSSGTLSATLGTSIDSSEITDGTIAGSDIAAGTLTLDKLGQNSCNTNQIIKWSGSAWACAADVDTDTNTTYSAGSGLSLASTTFSLNLATGGGLTFAGGALTLLNTCGNGQYLAWSSGGFSWNCASVAAAANEFQTVAGDSGSAVADSATDTISLTGGNGLTSTGSDVSDSVTFDIDLASGSGLAFSSGALTLQSCSDGQILKRVSNAWACAADTDTMPANAYRQQLAGTDNVTVGSSLTPLLTNGSGTAQSLGITITSGNEVSLAATIELSSSTATGPATYVLIRDDNHDNDCVTGGGDGTQIGGQVTSFVASIAQSFTTTLTFTDSSPAATTGYYQLCASTTIALGTTTATDRSLLLHEINL